MRIVKICVVLSLVSCLLLSCNSETANTTNAIETTETVARDKTLEFYKMWGYDTKEGGYLDDFLGLWRAGGRIDFVTSGDEWVTENFKMVITTHEHGEDRNIEMSLETFDVTIDECIYDQQMLIYAFAWDDANPVPLLTNTMFFDIAKTGPTTEYTASASVDLYSFVETKTVRIVAVIDGCVHLAYYRCNAENDNHEN